MNINWNNVEFKNEKRYLSNMYPCKIVFEKDSIYKKEFPEFYFDGFEYGSSEHLYQALKSKNTNWHERIRELKDPRKTKVLARKLLTNQETLFDNDLSFLIREDWDDVKLKVMELCLLLKFSQNTDLKEKLLKEETPIVERNDWGDTFWGVSNGFGSNHLGRLLEKVRKRFLIEKKVSNF
jgi:ribA/ribD-fused uncharacterized protein